MMRKIISVSAFLFVFVLSVVFADAQETPKQINGGVLNGKAVSLPKPVYPDEAKAAKLEGTVAIRVTIDEEGNIADAEPNAPGSTVRTVDADGAVTTTTHSLPDPSLVESALNAANAARFSPTLLNGQPVKVTGVIVYNFVASAANTTNSVVLNGKAIELPTPEFPASAKAMRVSGTVSVRIVVGENGEVIFAEAVSGHPLLRAAATDAAKIARFSPARLQGNPVKVEGLLTFNFAPPDEGNN